MAQLPDTIVLADKVMHLLRTKYSEWTSKDLPFDAAFMELMDKYDVHGDKRHAIKVAIGHELSARKKNSSATGARGWPHITPSFTFVVDRKTRSEVTLCCQMMGSKITYRRGADGTIVNTAFTDSPPQIAIQKGLLRAQEIFTEMDNEAILASEIRIVERTETRMHAVLGGIYDAYLARGKMGFVVAVVTLKGVEILQKDVPGSLVAEVRAIAKAHFKDTRTGDLFAH